MKYELVLIGAHTGAKANKFIRRHAERGRVLLVEPLPHLNAQLQERFSGLANIEILQAAVSDVSGIATLHYIPEDKLEGLPGWASELASLRPNHSTDHLGDVANRVKHIEVEKISIDDLLAKYEITEIGQLLTDTEGHDYNLLMCFPYWRLKPSRITFEHKHIDGSNTVGIKYAEALMRLIGCGYKCKIIDAENTAAELTS